MNIKIRFSVVAISVALLWSMGCDRSKTEVSLPPANTFAINGSLREMVLYPDPPPNFPEHEGRTEFMSYCAICHTLKYIAIQPNFPAKTWDAEVSKMIQKYKAPIDSVTAKKITAYLVAIKGKK